MSIALGIGCGTSFTSRGADANFPSPTMYKDFAGTKTLGADITFTRASVGTYFDSTGTMQTATNDVARFDHDPVTLVSRGLMVEEARTNLVLNSLLDGTSLSTQGVTVTAVAHTLSFYGTGAITLSGASTAGPLTGTSATTRSSLTFTPSAGTLTLTVSGQVKWCNLEAGSFATSFIPTAGASVPRAVDSVLMTGTNFSDWYNATEGTFVIVADTSIPTSPANGRLMAVDDGTASNRMEQFVFNTGMSFTSIITGGVTQTSASSSGSVSYVNGIQRTTAFAYKVNDVYTKVSGEPNAMSDIGVTIPVVDRLRLGTSVAVGALNGHIQRVAYYPKRLSNSIVVGLSS